MLERCGARDIRLRAFHRPRYLSPPSTRPPDEGVLTDARRWALGGWQRCAGSSVTSVRGRLPRYFWRGCTGWSTAATTAREWRSMTAHRSSSARKSAVWVSWRSSSMSSPSPETWGSVTPGGRRTAGSRTPTRTRTSAATARSSLFTTALSRTTPRSRPGCRSEGYVFHSQTDTEVVAHLIAHHYEEQCQTGRRPAQPQDAPDVGPGSAAVPEGDVRSGDPLPRSSGPLDRGAMRQSAGRRRRQGGVLPGQRCQPAGRVHAGSGVSLRSRDRACHGR